MRAPEDNASITAESLIRDVQRLRGTRCANCSAPLCGHQLLMSIAMSFKETPRCPRCLAKALDQEPAVTLDYTCNYIQRRECFRDAWEWACHDEKVSVKRIPVCIATEPSSP